MKTFFVWLALALGVVSARSEEWIRTGAVLPELATRYGAVYKNVQFVRVTKDCVIFDCTGGRTSLSTDQLQVGTKFYVDDVPPVQPVAAPPRVLTEEENVQVAWQWYQWCLAHPNGGNGITQAERNRLMTQNSTVLAWWRAEQQRRAAEAMRPQIMMVMPLTGPNYGPQPVLVFPPLR